jgi:hypothetical protein
MHGHEGVEVSRGPAKRPEGELPEGSRRRSFCFLERDGDRWTVFLVTHRSAEGMWRGRFAFRGSGSDEEELCTANLFIERSEAEIDGRARSLGRPLVRALLESALHTRERQRGFSSEMREWFRRLLATHSAELVPELATSGSELSLQRLRDQYDSYRLDQVAHLITLTAPDDFAALVDRILDGQTIDFRSRDRLQLAMMVVEEIEQYLPLPPFEVWAEDYIANREKYELYAHELHRGLEPGPE